MALITGYYPLKAYYIVVYRPHLFSGTVIDSNRWWSIGIERTLPFEANTLTNEKEQLP